jgi:hypothetical protein
MRNILTLWLVSDLINTNYSNPELNSQLKNMKTAYEEASNVSEKSNVALTAFMKTTLDANKDLPEESQAQVLADGFAQLTDSHDFLSTGTGWVTLASPQGNGGLVANDQVKLNFSSGIIAQGGTNIHLIEGAAFTQVQYAKEDLVFGEYRGASLFLADQIKSRGILLELGAETQDVSNVLMPFITHGSLSNSNIINNQEVINQQRFLPASEEAPRPNGRTQQVEGYLPLNK